MDEGPCQVSEQIPPQAARAGAERPDSWEKIWDLGAPWCNAGFRCSIKVLTGPAAHDETGRNPRSECSSECSACTAEAGR